MKSPRPSSKRSSPGESGKPIRLRLSRAAEADLEAIDACSSDHFGADRTDSYMRGFRELFDLLRSHPFAGRAVPDVGKGVRSLTHRSHHILYRADRNLVLIVRILHHAQDTKRWVR